MMAYIEHLFVMISIYALLGQSLNFFSGFTGLISIAHASFFGIGAYSSALITIHYTDSFFVNILLPSILTGCISFVIARISLRSYEDYFILMTLGIQIVLFSLFNNCTALTNGPIGISGISNFSTVEQFIPQPILIFLCYLFFSTIMIVISRSSWALNLKGINDDEILMLSLGKNVQLIKVTAFTFSAMTASVAGVLYAHYMTYIDPSSFSLDESVFIVAIMVLGRGSYAGIFLSATFMIMLPECLRFIGLSGFDEANIKQLVVGMMIVGVVFWGKLSSRLAVWKVA
ncbi:branched-chain amino acid ABC transporter permease [Desulfovibrio sp. JC010]|uniref:branched-chain amino acid ABC transporter permease n=1 Tax=Desulfovibrio sp. JC010 TaxID=2593641 RepID=UPI0013D77984|nr:branched-chain amino acid ABC transporter permease [Desulfovibrio sp. JC010]NDV26892.1 branched-chain amino acid ABC transporter permease [Desulfovibrio sp. JC010]